MVNYITRTSVEFKLFTLLPQTFGVSIRTPERSILTPFVAFLLYRGKKKRRREKWEKGTEKEAQVLKVARRMGTDGAV